MGDTFSCSLAVSPFPDVASADQQKAAGPHQDDQNDEDVAMETDKPEEDLQAAQELKPEQLDSTKASQKGDASSLF